MSFCFFASHFFNFHIYFIAFETLQLATSNLISLSITMHKTMECKVTVSSNSYCGGMFVFLLFGPFLLIWPSGQLIICIWSVALLFVIIKCHHSHLCIVILATLLVKQLHM